MIEGPIAILGAGSQLAGDYVAHALNHDFRLFARTPELARASLRTRGRDVTVSPLDSFGSERYAAVINFIGVGDPARALALGASIFEATHRWDGRVLSYLAGSPETRYVFMSSGAVYGDAFDAPVSIESRARFPINALGPQNWYALAKLGAEALHRASSALSIIDLRIFNYVSRNQNTAGRFFLTELIRTIRNGSTFRTTAAEMVRDYLSPPGLRDLIDTCLAAPLGTNRPADAYSRAPVAKSVLLELMAQHYGLQYEIVESAEIVVATGAKPYYYSLDRTAADWGYTPRRSSVDAILEEAGPMIAAGKPL